MVRKIWRFSIAFKNGKKSIEQYFSKQMRIKYHNKMVESMLLLILLVLLQEILIWLAYTPGVELYYIRVLIFFWIIFAGIYIFVNSNVTRWITLTLLAGKTALYLADFIHLRLTFLITEERTILAFYLFCTQAMVDSLICISMGIFTVVHLVAFNSILYIVMLATTLSLRLEFSSTPSYILVFTFFFIFNTVDLMNHFDTELTLFFNYIRIEQKGYYLNTFVDRLLPKHIKGVTTCGTEKYTNVTLLFADIVGFTEYSAGKNPRQVVEMLSQLFTAFDKECNKLNLYKLFTIGDCYVVMSFLDKNNRKKPKEEANDVLQLAMFMLKAIQEVRKKINFERLNMRIGIHTVAYCNKGYGLWRSHRHRYCSLRPIWARRVNCQQNGVWRRARPY